MKSAAIKCKHYSKLDWYKRYCDLIYEKMILEA